MNPDCKAARLHLKGATRSEYNALVYEAKLTPEQEEILNRHILKAETIVKISLDLHCSTTNIKNRLHEAYNIIGKVMMGGSK